MYWHVWKLRITKSLLCILSFKEGFITLSYLFLRREPPLVSNVHYIMVHFQLWNVNTRVQNTSFISCVFLCHLCCRELSFQNMILWVEIIRHMDSRIERDSHLPFYFHHFLLFLHLSSEQLRVPNRIL